MIVDNKNVTWISDYIFNSSFLFSFYYSLVFNHVEGVIVQRWIRSFGIVRKSLVLNLRKYAGTSS